MASSSSVKIYSVATTRVISTLNVQTSSEQGTSVNSTITALLINPQNPFQLITASEDGRVRIWDFLDAVLLRTIESRIHISHMATHPFSKDHVVVVARRTKSEPCLQREMVSEANKRLQMVDRDCTEYL